MQQLKGVPSHYKSHNRANNVKGRHLGLSRSNWISLGRGQGFDVVLFDIIIEIISPLGEKVHLSILLLWFNPVKKKFDFGSKIRTSSLCS